MPDLDPLEAQNWTLITPSYRGDLQQFELLTESFEKMAPSNLRHLVIVDRADLELFKKFTHNRMHLVAAEDLLPGRVKKINKPKQMWLSTKFPPVRNWIAQQIIKIQAATTADTPYVLFADSDVVFLRPFEMSKFTDGNLLALSRVQAQYDSLVKWRESSAKLLGLENPEKFAKVNYVSNLIPWRRDTAQKMIAAIEESRRWPWTFSVGSNLNFSEYTLYGTFCEEKLGLSQAGHYGWDDPILNLCWDEPMQTLEEIQTLLDRTLPEHVGAMFHSKNHFDRSHLRTAVEKFWSNV